MNLVEILFLKIISLSEIEALGIIKNMINSKDFSITKPTHQHRIYLKPYAIGVSGISELSKNEIS